MRGDDGERGEHVSVVAQAPRCSSRVITEHRSRGVSVEVVSARVNVTPEVVEKHYDERSAEEKRAQRRGALGEKFGGV